MKRREVATLGRCGVDLYPLATNTPLAEVQDFRKFLGGSATNVAVAAARYGRDVTALTGVGEDPFGQFVINELQRLGVDASHVVVNSRYNTPITFCELFPPDDFPLYFYRQPTTPDLELGVEHLPADLNRYEIVWLTVSGLSREPSRTAHHAAVTLPREGLTIVDLDYRPRFWPSPEVARAEVQWILPHVDVAIGNREECRVATGLDDPRQVADYLLDQGLSMVIVKQGVTGTFAATAEEETFVASFEVPVLNGLGAGDAFGGAVCHGVLAGWDLERIIRFASAAGAIVAARLECANAMPEAWEVEAVLAGDLSVLDRDKGKA